MVVVVVEVVVIVVVEAVVIVAVAVAVHMYRVAHKKRPQFSALEKDTCSKPRQNCCGSWIDHCLYFTYLSRQ